MAIYLAQLIDNFRDLIEDDSDTLVTFAKKVRWLNAGLAAMFPTVYLMTQDVSLEIDLTPDPIYEYTIPASIAGGLLQTVEIETEDGSGVYERTIRYQIINLASTNLIQLNQDLTDLEGSRIRLTAAAPLTPFVAASYVASASVVYDGPAYMWQLPVYYAMSLAFSTSLFGRLDYSKASVQIQNSAITTNDLMTAAQFWMDRFLSQLNDVERPLPVVSV